MAFTVLQAIERPRGYEILVEVGTGEVVRLWKFEHDAAEPPAVTRAWITDQLQALQAARQAQDTEDAAEEAEIDAQDFFTWMYQHRGNQQLRDILRPAARYYRENVV